MKLKALFAAVLVTAGVTVHASDALRQQANAMFGVLPAAMPGSENDSPAMIKLGEQLYMDKRLSVNDSQSCNSCHNVTDNGPGVDNLPTSPGAFGKNGDRNSPTVWNAGFQFVQFWDGREPDLVAQAKGPIMNPVEMAMPAQADVEKKLRAVPEYQASFKAVFGGDEPISYHNIAVAIAAFERTLITRDRFDDYLRGDDNALNEQEKRGLQAFISSGCVACHSGPTLGGSSYQKMGLVNAYANQADQGRFAVTGKEQDRMMFKTPMLRDVARTAPYFHDGSVKTLAEAVRQMAWLQLGQKLDDGKVEDITAFLKALNHKG